MLRLQPLLFLILKRMFLDHEAEIHEVCNLLGEVFYIDEVKEILIYRKESEQKKTNTKTKMEQSKSNSDQSLIYCHCNLILYVYIHNKVIGVITSQFSFFRLSKTRVCSVE